MQMMLFAFVQSSAEIILHDATDITQTKATLSADFPNLDISHGFQYKQGSLPEIDTFSKTALAYNSDPVQITTTGTYAWMAKASKGQVESNPNVPVGEMSEMSISVNLSATASVSFEWSVDSEEEIGFLSFALDGNTVKSISGLVDFTRESFQILEGVHTLSWRYSKKAASNVGLDKGMVRSICVQNTTPGEWAYASTTGSSVTIESLNSGKDYIFRASSTERKNNSIKVDWSAPKSFKTLAIVPSDIEEITTTQSTASVKIKEGEFGDAGVKNYLEASMVPKNSIVNVMDNVVPPTCVRSSVGDGGKSEITSDGTLSVEVGCYEWWNITIEFNMKEAGKIEFEYDFNHGFMKVYDNGKKLSDLYNNKKNCSYQLSEGIHEISIQADDYYNMQSVMNVNIRHIKIENIDTSYSFQDCETKQSVDGSSIATLAGLIPDTYYFCRISSEQQLAGEDKNCTYSQWKRFKTKAISIDTCYVTDIKPSSATIVSEMTIGDANIETAGVSYKANGSERWVDFPNTTGESRIVQALTRLKHKSKYDYRAYLQARGCDTIYSEAKTFETKQTIGIDSITRISQISAVVNGYAFSQDDISEAKVAYGIVGTWGECEYENECDITIDDLGLFAIKISGLLPGKNYSVKTVGIIDGETITDIRTFSTPSFFENNIEVEDIRYITAHVGVTLAETVETVDSYGFVVTLYKYLTDEYRYVDVTPEGQRLQAKLTGLAPGKEYYVCPYAVVDGKRYLGDFKAFSTRKYNITHSITTTQTTATITVFNVINSDDETAKVESLSCEINGKRYNIADRHDGRAQVTINNLWGTYTISKFTAKINGEWYTWETNGAGKPFTFSTKPVKIGFDNQSGQTYLDMNWTVDCGDATYLGSKAVVNQIGSSTLLADTEINDMCTLFVNELNPGTEYAVKIYVQTAEGGLAVAHGVVLATDAIECKTNDVTNISNRSARMNGEIDCDSYSSAEFGFQWKQMQGWESAPAYTKGVKQDNGTISVALVNGMLEPNTDYQFRAAVRYHDVIFASNDWKTFRTESEFVYYPATVYTLFRTDRENNALVLCGYFIAGSETIVSQGYEYWQTDKQSTIAFAPGHISTITTDESMQHIFRNGELANGNYAVRAFVKTESGETLYGATLGFAVSDSGYSGIEGIDADEVEMFVDGTTLKVVNAQGLSCFVYTLDGIMVCERFGMTDYEEITLSANATYIVKLSNGKVLKVRVR